MYVLLRRNHELSSVREHLFDIFWFFLFRFLLEFNLYSWWNVDLSVKGTINCTGSPKGSFSIAPQWHFPQIHYISVLLISHMWSRGFCVSLERPAPPNIDGGFRELLSKLFPEVLSVSWPSQLKEHEAKPWRCPAIRSIQPSSPNAPSKKPPETSTVRAASGTGEPPQHRCFWKPECSACHFNPVIVGAADPLSYSRFPAATCSWLSWTTSATAAVFLQWRWIPSRSCISFQQQRSPCRYWFLANFSPACDSKP